MNPRLHDGKKGSFSIYIYLFCRNNSWFPCSAFSPQSTFPNSTPRSLCHKLTLQIYLRTHREPASSLASFRGQSCTVETIFLLRGELSTSFLTYSTRAVSRRSVEITYIPTLHSTRGPHPLSVPEPGPCSCFCLLENRA